MAVDASKWIHTKEIHWKSHERKDGTVATMCRRCTSADRITVNHDEITCPICKAILGIIQQDDYAEDQAEAALDTFRQGIAVEEDLEKKRREALSILDGCSHSILKVEKAREIARDLGMNPDRVSGNTFIDRRSDPKGARLAGKSEGEKAEGVDAIDLARTIAGELGLETGLPFFGRGRNMSVLVDRIRFHFFG